MMILSTSDEEAEQNIYQSNQAITSHENASIDAPCENQNRKKRDKSNREDKDSLDEPRRKKKLPCKNSISEMPVCDDAPSSSSISYRASTPHSKQLQAGACNRSNSTDASPTQAGPITSFSIQNTTPTTQPSQIDSLSEKAPTSSSLYNCSLTLPSSHSSHYSPENSQRGPEGSLLQPKRLEQASYQKIISTNPVYFDGNRQDAAPAITNFQCTGRIRCTRPIPALHPPLQTGLIPNPIIQGRRIQNSSLSIAHLFLSNPRSSNRTHAIARQLLQLELEQIDDNLNNLEAEIITSLERQNYQEHLFGPPQ